MPRKFADALLVTEQVAPGTPAAGALAIYSKSDHKLYILDSTGVETALGAGGGGGTTIAYQTTAPASPTTGMLWVDSDAPSGTYDEVAVFGSDGALTVKTGTSRWRFPFAATILGTTASVGTAPTGASLILDVKKNGTTIYSTTGNRPTIAISGFATTTEPTPDVTAMAVGDYLTVDVAQIGSTVAGSDLTVFVRYRRT